MRDYSDDRFDITYSMVGISDDDNKMMEIFTQFLDCSCDDVVDFVNEKWSEFLEDYEEDEEGK